MKAFINEYLHIIMYAICGILLVLGSYNILININHYSYISKSVVASDGDSNYKEFKNNLAIIEKNISNYHGNKNNKLYYAVSNTFDILKQGGVYQLLPNSKIGYEDLYQLNNYYLSNIIDVGWTSNLKSVVNNDHYNKIMDYLIKKADYFHQELLNNSNFQYDIKDIGERDSLDEKYHFLLDNYCFFSSLLVEISQEIGG